MVIYDPQAKVKEARRIYFEANDLGEGGYEDPWVHVQFGPIPIRFPNSPARVRSVRLHDLHHLITDFHTDLAGEAEIGAWEIASGCVDHYAAWVLNLMAMAYGLWLCPRRLAQAFFRGRRSTNLYHRDFAPDLLELTVAELRQRVSIPPETVVPTLSDRVALIGWAGVATTLGLAITALLLSPFAVLGWLLL